MPLNSFQCLLGHVTSAPMPAVTPNYHVLWNYLSIFPKPPAQLSEKSINHSPCNLHDKLQLPCNTGTKREISDFSVVTSPTRVNIEKADEKMNTCPSIMKN